MKGKAFIGGLLTGAVVGAAIGLLTAPQSGEDTRESVRGHAREFTDKVRESSKQLVDSGRDLVEQGKNRLASARMQCEKVVPSLRNTDEPGAGEG